MIQDGKLSMLSMDITKEMVKSAHIDACFWCRGLV